MSKKKPDDNKSDGKSGGKTVLTSNVNEEIHNALYMTLYRFEDVIIDTVRTKLAFERSEKQRKELADKILKALLSRDVLTYIFNFKLQKLQKPTTNAESTGSVGSVASAGSVGPAGSVASTGVGSAGSAGWAYSPTLFWLDAEIIVQVLIAVRNGIYNVTRDHVKWLEEKQPRPQPQIKPTRIEIIYTRIGGEFLTSSLWVFSMCKKQLEAKQYKKLKVNSNHNMQVIQEIQAIKAIQAKQAKQAKQAIKAIQAKPVTLQVALQVTQGNIGMIQFMKDMKDNVEILKTHVKNLKTQKQQHAQLNFFARASFHSIVPTRDDRPPFQINERFVSTFDVCLFAFFDWLLQIIYIEDSLDYVYKEYCKDANRGSDHPRLTTLSFVWILLTIFWFHIKKEQANESEFVSEYFRIKQNSQQIQRRHELLKVKFQNVILELVKKSKPEPLDQDDQEVIKMFLKTLFEVVMS